MLTRLIYLFIALFITVTIRAREVALTIDDLPYVGKAANNPGKLRRERKRFKMVLHTLQTEKVPATGFVVANYIEDGQWDLLKAFHQSDNIIGNHSFSHQNLNQVGAERFIQDVAKADKILAPLMSKPKYFRYPFLAVGHRCKTYLKVRHFLQQHGYLIAPVTIDSKDYKLNERFHAVPWRQRKHHMHRFEQKYLRFIAGQIQKAEQKTQRIAGRPVKQILLIHMNTLNAYFLPAVIHLFRQKGYKFVTLPEAMSDPYYQLESTISKEKSTRCPAISR